MIYQLLKKAISTRISLVMSWWNFKHLQPRTRYGLRPGRFPTTTPPGSKPSCKRSWERLLQTTSSALRTPKTNPPAAITQEAMGGRRKNQAQLQAVRQPFLQRDSVELRGMVRHEVRRSTNSRSPTRLVYALRIRACKISMHLAYSIYIKMSQCLVRPFC